MNQFTVYPAIDLRNGKVVRLRQGDAARQKIYGDDPGAVTQEWIDQGAEWLHVVNLNGAFGEDTEQNEIAIMKILAVGRNVAKGRWNQEFTAN
jgi:phosphoribosylformimino-5-aminoimidazole carboxamide ribotide isomerase